MNANKLKEIKKQANLALARKDFFHFCKLLQPKFYKDSREYLKILSDEMQRFYEGEDEILIVNMPPRMGKSLTGMQFAKWVFGKNINERIMTASYNERLSSKFAKGVRNGISEEKANEDTIIYNDIFQKTKIKYGEAQMSLWSLDGAYDSYLATSPGGTATGFGASLIIVDDLIKNHKEAFNATVLEDHWEWYVNTLLSRLEEGGKMIIIMTRWSSKDLAGRALEYFTEEGKKVVHINMKAMQDDGTMLCEEVLSKESYLMKTKAMSHEIAMANYQQEPIDVKGRLYTTLKTYSGELPRFKEIKNVTDTADTGADYLCSINYGVTFDDEAYILDVLYTQEGMEVTEPKHAKMLFEGNVNVSDIESNNGGRGYARNVERILKTTYGTNRVIIKPFHQSGNKESRILSTSSWVMEHVYFPEGWRNKWPDFYKSMMEYQKNGKNAHDDAQDALALLAEKINSKPKFESW